MQNRIKGAVSSLKDNRGAGIITVLLAMFFVTTLGSAILYMAYTGLLIRSTEERGVRNFYDTAELMDELQAGFYTVASDSAGIAYNEALIRFSEDSASFSTQYSAAVLDWVSASSQPLAISGGTNTYYYDTRVLSELLLHGGVPREDIYIVGVDDPAEEIRPIHLSGNVTTPPAGLSTIYGNMGTIAYDDESITFEGISINYTNPTSGISTTVTADIELSIPDYTSGVPGGASYDFSDIFGYAAIAKGDITFASGATFDGSLYADNIILQGTGNTVIDETVITANELEVPLGHTVTVQANGQLWAQGIDLSGTSSTLNVMRDGAVYVQNDIALNGTGSVLNVTGSIYGFGDSIDTPTQSSAIVINGLDTTVELSNIQRLMLAGHSFILEPRTDDVIGGILMGESISAAPNQLAYLAPTSILNNIDSNPLLLSAGEAVPSFTPPGNTQLFPDGSTLDTFGATVQTMVYPLPSTPATQAVYYFLTFATPQGANDYFSRYFSFNSAEISSYLDAYTALYNVTNDPETAGNTLITDGAGGYVLPSVNPLSAVEADGLESLYSSLGTTLSGVHEAGSTPYDYLVSQDGIVNFGRLFAPQPAPTWPSAFLNLNKDFVGYFTPTDITLTPGSFYANADFIISTANVQVNADFDGLIICAGDITVGPGGKLTGDSTKTRSAIDAEYGTHPYSMADFLTGSSFNSFDALVSNEGLQDITDYVGYSYWEKT